MGINEKRWLDAAHFRDVITTERQFTGAQTLNVPDQLTRPNLPHLTIIPAVPTMVTATATPVAVPQDNVGKEDPANMGQGETPGYDYDTFDNLSDAADKRKAQFADKDARGG